MSEYEMIPTSPDLSVISLADAFCRIRPLPVIAILHTSDRLFQVARRTLAEVHADSMDNPLAPGINLQVDNDLGPHEWWLEYGDRRVGSKGY